MFKKITTEVVLVGGGPACASAAIQLARSGVEIILLSESIGGLVANANLIENFLGFPNGISGKKYVELIRKHLKRFKVPIIQEKVIRVEKHTKSSYLITTTKTKLTANFIIIGTGSIPRKLKIEGEDEAFKEKKLFYEIYDIEFNVLDKDIIIIGSGDVAYDYALSSCKTSKSIKIVQRSKKTNSLLLLQERVSNIKNIRVLKDKVPIKIKNHKKSITLILKTTQGLEKLSSDIILVAIGRKPNIACLSPSLIEEYYNPIESSNLFFVGDVKNYNFRQISIAIGDGVKAAMKIVKNIKEK